MHPRQLCLLLGHTLKSIEHNLIRARFSPRDNIVASGSADRCVHLWDVSSLKRINSESQKLGGHKGSVNDVAFSYDSAKDAGVQTLVASASSALAL